MRIVCPSCQAAYEVPEKLLGDAPRKVSCARCGNTWVPTPSPPPPVEAAAAPAVEAPASKPHDPPEPAGPELGLPPPPPVLAEPAPPMVPRPEQKLVPPSEPRPGRGRVLLAALAWVASLALLVGAGWAAVTWRAEIMALWAPSRRVFALLGLE